MTEKLDIENSNEELMTPEEVAEITKPKRKTTRKPKAAESLPIEEVKAKAEAEAEAEASPEELPPEEIVLAENEDSLLKEDSTLSADSLLDEVLIDMPDPAELVPENMVIAQPPSEEAYLQPEYSENPLLEGFTAEIPPTPDKEAAAKPDRQGSESTKAANKGKAQKAPLKSKRDAAEVAAILEEEENKMRVARPGRFRNSATSGVLTIESKGKRFDPVEERRKVCIQKINYARQSGNPLENLTISRFGPDPSTGKVYGFGCTFGPFEIFIPIDMYTTETIKPQNMFIYMRSRLNSKVDVLPIAFISTEHQNPTTGEKYTREVLYASRVKAMEARIRRFWYGTNETRNEKKQNTTNYRITPNSLVECRVITALNRSIIVEIYGKELVIRAPELSYNFIPDARTVFAPGDKVVARILSIKRYPEGDRVDVEASVKQAKPDAAIFAYNELQEKCVYIGTVQAIVLDGPIGRNGLYVHVLGDSSQHNGIDVLCDYPSYTVMAGDKVEIIVTSKRTKERIDKRTNKPHMAYQARGNVVHVYPRELR